ncbi:DHA2 family efflux MFS transporter permease subunit [Novosphingobium mangrovi (ex Huang et al. 2023)]|uniref:DHA2 family efflux MFS transporter permease subunit n=1 Tax=Novosphingobium mangrovi (ex Huang et al. 2023) TaxID=2976432 RepID=A0ABT2I5A8_9SPHN|nr:DHA2 family efflux MFS transporter permease subunit [Novosphingobium mangrovi (ex Huang et al. 2023)]MCT2399993.1 DHA2 family efflux MFS transporter permease subunit [Novosphingobium mangrovi (ex Huang et al. 2023)]
MHAYPTEGRRRLITVFTLAAAFMTQLDATIANVALPHMQASTAASREQITWVLTSYIIMSAIFTPLSGWLASRFGRKRLFVSSVIGFTLASMLCGMAANFEQLVLFRMLQGTMGAALLPMSQAILLDINPPERHGSAMATWGLGVILGPICGPILGGWLIEAFNWRWIFFINLPFGIAAVLGLLAVLPAFEDENAVDLDFTGFALLAVAIGSFQLMLDRGQMLDWFESREIWIEATLAVTAFYMFMVHTLTTDRPFVNLAIFRDRNFAVGSVFAFFLGGLMYSVMAMTAPLLADLMGYPAVLVGLAMAPRGIGTMLMMPIVGMLVNRGDPRVLIVIGMVISGVSTAMMAGFSLHMDARLVEIAGFVQGVGGAFLFVPITTVIFATIPPHLRNQGTAMNSLIRALGASVWISVMQSMTIRNEATVHARLAEGVRPDNPALLWRWQDFDFSSAPQMIRASREIGRQALMVSYTDSFWLLYVFALALAPLVVLLRYRRR